MNIRLSVGNGTTHGMHTGKYIQLVGGLLRTKTLTGTAGDQHKATAF